MSEEQKNEEQKDIEQKLEELKVQEQEQETKEQEPKEQEPKEQEQSEQARNDQEQKTQGEALAKSENAELKPDEAQSAVVSDAPPVNAEREAKLKAAAEARAARAAAKEKEAADAAAVDAVQEEEPKPPSLKQVELDDMVALLKRDIAENAVEDAYLNELNSQMPMLIVNNAHWRSVASMLKQHEKLRFTYLRNVSGIDYESHMEVVYHMVALDSKREVGVKIKTERDAGAVYSATPVWATANWNEREIFDLLGIDFPGHPDLRRIMMPDDWVGHPLRKDYEPLDSEV